MKKKAPKKAEAAKEIQIPRLQVKHAKITIVGTSPLITNRFSHEAKAAIEGAYRKTESTKKVPLSVEQEFEASLYPIPGKKNTYGIPAAALKNTAVSACGMIDGLAMTFAKKVFHVEEDVAGLVEISGSDPVIDRRTVRVGPFGSKKPCMRTRARFDKWEITFTIRYLENQISLEQILNLYEHAGFGVGVCEARAEKCALALGGFIVKRK